MATSRSTLLRFPISQSLKTLISNRRALSTTTTTSSSSLNHGHDLDHDHDQDRNHQYLSPTNYLNSWKPPKDPKEALARLAKLRRDYAKQVKEVRKEYIHEMELQRLEKKRKDDAKKEAIRIANEERRATKAALKKVQAAERELAQEEFRKTLSKERAEKLEYWRKREKAVQERKSNKNELLHRESSMWIDEPELEKRILEAVLVPEHP